MEWLIENQFYISSTLKFFPYFLRSILVFFASLITLRLYWNWKHDTNALQSLPSCKERSYNFLGTMRIFMKYIMYRYPAPINAYITTMLTGYVKVYGKNGLALVYQVLHPAVVVYKADAVEMILNHSTELKKAWFYKFLHPWLGDGLLTTHGSKWKDRRKMLTPCFHFNILKDFLPVFNKQSRILSGILQGHSKSDYVDIVPFITKCSFDVICESILGTEMHSQTQDNCDYMESVNTITDIVAHRTVTPWLWPDILLRITPSGRKFLYHRNKVHALATKFIAAKKKEKLEKQTHNTESVQEPEETGLFHSRHKRALLDLLLDEHINNDSISLIEIREEVDTFMFEGHDTTAMAMSWSLYLIGLHPDVQAKIHAELDAIFGDDDRDATMDDLRDMKYLECVFKETLRLYPSVPGYGRHLEEDINFKGQVVPKGCTCFVWAYFLHRDPDVFPNPEYFDPERFSPENSTGRHPFAYVPFSAGPRNCIGQKFAILEMKSVLSTILRKYRIRSLEPRDRIHEVFEVVLRPPNGIKIEIRNRK